MEEIIYWVVFFILLSLGMNVYKKWANKESPKKEMMTDEEVDSLESEEFPSWYVLITIFYVVAMVGIAVGLLLACYNFLNVYPEWILAGKEYIAVSTNPWGAYLMLLAFFPGILLGGLVFTPIALLFPRFERYMYKSQLKQGIKSKPNHNLTRWYVKWTSISLAVVAPLLLLAADNYRYVDENALHYNAFLGIGEKSIPLENLTMVEFGAWPNNGANASGINWEYALVFNDGKQFNFKEADKIELKALDTHLMERGVPLEVTKLNSEARNWITRQASGELKEFFDQVLDENR